MKWSIGDTLLSRYRVKEVFHSGGMGIVYRVHHLVWNIDLALKHPRPEYSESLRAIQEFERECEIWSNLGLHPYVATCFYTRRMEPFTCVFAEFVEGGSLRDWIIQRRLYSGEEPAMVAKILTVAVQMAWGLERAHESGLIHCDMKPGNVLMTDDGTAKITDFGLAKALSLTGGAGIATGWTEAYASPEQMRRAQVDRTTDIWSWAVSVMEMFMGGIQWQSGPVAGAALEDLGERGRKAVGLPVMPEAVFDLLTRCLRYQAAQRPGSFAEIAENLREIYEEEFGEPCDAVRPESELLGADSLNNRAVSLLDVGKPTEAEALFRQALDIDPHHPEATFNLVALRTSRNESMEVWAAKNLSVAAAAEPGNEVPPRLLAQLQNCLDGKAKIPLAAVFAKPRSGSDFNADVIRFRRLMDKTDAAIAESRWDDARRYARMCGDIEGFGRHPRLRRIRERLSKSP
jgi:serine/threonine protein kinase